MINMVRPTLVRINNFERRINQQFMFKNMQRNAPFISVNFNFFQGRGGGHPLRTPRDAKRVRASASLRHGFTNLQHPHKKICFRGPCLRRRKGSGIMYFYPILSLCSLPRLFSSILSFFFIVCPRGELVLSVFLVPISMEP